MSNEDLLGKGNTPSKAAVATPPKAEPKKDEPTFDVKIDLGTSADHITVNNKRLYHGHTYKLTQAGAELVNEICFNTRMHEEVVNGRANVSGGTRPVRR